MTRFMPIVSDVLIIILLVAVPTVTFLPRLKKPEDIGKRMWISVLGTWAALVLHHWYIGRPVSFALAEAHGNRDYDGMAVSIAIDFFGWIPAVFVTTIATGVYLLIQYVRQRLQKRA